MSDSIIKHEKHEYRANLAGFIVQGLFAFLFGSLSILTCVFMFFGKGSLQDNPFFKLFFTAFSETSQGQAEEKLARFINAYLLGTILSSALATGYLITAMVKEWVFWHHLAYLTNYALGVSLIMTVLTWYVMPMLANGLGWVWTVLLVLALGEEAQLILVHFVDPKHSYVLPWVRVDAVPEAVIY